MNETLSPRDNVMEMNYIYCVPCHNLLLNKRTVLEKAPVMIRVAARGQCGSAGGGDWWRTSVEPIPQVDAEGGKPSSVMHDSVAGSCSSVDLPTFVGCILTEWMDLVSPAW